MRGTLTFDPKTDRWCAAGRPLHAGDEFQIELAGGAWLTVRFLWQTNAGGLPPTGYCVVDLAKGEAKLHPPVGASVRFEEPA